jgi:hypothetical protein
VCREWLSWRSSKLGGGGAHEIYKQESRAHWKAARYRAGRQLLPVGGPVPVTDAPYAAFSLPNSFATGRKSVKVEGLGFELAP